MKYRFWTSCITADDSRNPVKGDMSDTEAPAFSQGAHARCLNPRIAAIFRRNEDSAPATISPGVLCRERSPRRRERTVIITPSRLRGPSTDQVIQMLTTAAREEEIRGNGAGLTVCREARGCTSQAERPLIRKPSYMGCKRGPGC